MSAPLAEAERRYHQSIAIPQQERRWRITADNRFWVRCCDLTSSIRYEDAASATDAAIYHLRGCGGGHE